MLTIFEDEDAILTAIIFPTQLDCANASWAGGTTDGVYFVFGGAVKRSIINKHVSIFANMCVCTIIKKHRINRRGEKINKNWGFPFHSIKTTVENRFV